jgi:hypothetical protein
MAVAFIMDFPGGRAEDYDAVVDKMQLNGRLPAGALFHAAGPTDSGWQVCDVWESADAFRQFADNKIGPITAQQGMAPPQVRSFDVQEIRRGESGPVEFVQIVHLPGLDAESFKAADKAVVGAEGAVPAACVFHVNGMLDGEWCVLDYWSSKEARDTFIERNVKPAMENANLTGAPTFESFVAHNVLTEPAEHPAGV